MNVRSTACLPFFTCFFTIVLRIGEGRRREDREHERRRENSMMRHHLCHTSYEGLHMAIRAKDVPVRGMDEPKPTVQVGLRPRDEARAIFSQELVEDNTASSGDIQRLLTAEHGNAYTIGRAFEERRRKPIDFIAEHHAYRKWRRPVEQSLPRSVTSRLRQSGRTRR